MHTSAVPAYPEEADWLMDVRRWPATRVMAGKTYVLEFGAQKSDVAYGNLKSLADIPPGSDYDAHYVTYGDDGKRSMNYGPWYCWRSDSTLRERYYVTREETRFWQYSRYGNLGRYAILPRDSTLTRMSVEEWFGANGALIACRLLGQHYWKGVEIDRDSLYPNLNEEWKRIGWTRPLSGGVLPPCHIPRDIVTVHWRKDRLDPRFTFRMPSAFVVDSTVQRAAGEDDVPGPRIWTDGKHRIEARPGIWDTMPLGKARALSLTYSECTDTLSGVPVWLATTYSPESSNYYVAAVPTDSVFPHLGILRTAIIASCPDSVGQHVLSAIIRTLSVEPAPEEKKQ